MSWLNDERQKGLIEDAKKHWERMEAIAERSARALEKLVEIKEGELKGKHLP